MPEEKLLHAFVDTVFDTQDATSDVIVEMDTEGHFDKKRPMLLFALNVKMWHCVKPRFQHERVKVAMWGTSDMKALKPHSSE